MSLGDMCVSPRLWVAAAGVEIAASGVTTASLTFLAGGVGLFSLLRALGSLREPRRRKGFFGFVVLDEVSWVACSGTSKGWGEDPEPAEEEEGKTSEEEG